MYKLDCQLKTIYIEEHMCQECKKKLSSVKCVECASVLCHSCFDKVCESRHFAFVSIILTKAWAQLFKTNNVS